MEGTSLIDEIIEAILTRDPNKWTGESLIIPNHLAQMKLFGIRQGIELYPQQDQGDIRKAFIDKLYTANKLDLYLERIWELFLCRGQILWYLRPTGSTYRIYYFEKNQFRAFYNADGDLDRVVIIYNYAVSSDLGAGIQNKRWVRIEITSNQIIQSETPNKPAFEQYAGQNPYNSKPIENSLGFIPCVISSNYLTEAGQSGHGDFDWLRNQLEAHEKDVALLRENLRFFGNPSLVTSRKSSEVSEPVGGGFEVQRSTIASGSQWVGSTYSTFKRDPFEPGASRLGGKSRVMRVIGNVETDERFGYIVPDPVTPDHVRQVAQDRESLHNALGGVDPLGISSGATAFEIKSIYGRTAATAMKKAKFLYTYGLCKVFEMAMQAEEIAFKRSLAIALKQPIEAITDQFALDLVGYGLDALPEDYRPVGLPPLGDRQVSWRWLGPVFEDSPQDILQKSIVVRNLEEIGVETIEAMGFLFSEKTRKERQDMLTGYPFREMNASSSALQQQLSVFMNLMQTPDPYTGQPLGLTLNNLDVIQRTIEHMTKRLNYGKSSDPADGDALGFTPAPSGGTDGPISPGISATGQLQPSPGLLSPGYGGNGSAVLQPTPTNGAGVAVPYNESAAAAGLAINPAAGYSFAGNPAATGAFGAGIRSVDFADPLPAPGSTVGRANDAPGRLSALPSAGIPGIPPDLQSSPGLLQQLFPSLFAPPEPVANPRRGSRRRRGK